MTAVKQYRLNSLGTIAKGEIRNVLVGGSYVAYLGDNSGNAIPPAVLAHNHFISDITGLQTALDGKAAVFSTGNIVQGTGITLSGTLTNRLVGSGNITISANVTGFATETWVTTGFAAKSTTLAGYGITNAYTKTEVDSGFVSSTPSTADWNTQHSGSKAGFVNSATNAPTATAHYGITIPNTTGTGGANLAFRNGASYFRTIEAGVIGSWQKLATETWVGTMSFATQSWVNSNAILNNNDAWKYRGGFNTVDANTLTLPGWYDNGSGAPSGDNYPVNSSGFIAVTPFRASSFSGFVQEYSTAGTVFNLNRNRRFWRTSWNGVFADWEEYASVSAVETLLTGYAVKATTLAGYGISNAYTKTESDGRYIQGSIGNILQASGFASTDYNLNPANTVRAHGGSVSYTNAPSISASTSTYRTVVTFDAHSVNALAGTYKGQIVFNSNNQMAFRQEVNSVWSGWVNVVTEPQIANFITASSANTLTNKSGNISMWTNNAGYITGINSGMISSALGFTPTSNAIGINTTNSLTGGGNLTTSRTLQLVGDSASPGNSRYYGTNASGTKGWFALPSGGGSGTVTQVGLLVPTGFTVTSSPVTTSGNLQFAFASGYSLPTTASQNTWNAKIGGSGTTNRISMFTAGSTLGDSPIYHSGSNIGIGISPSHKLHVSGNIYAAGHVTSTGQITGTFLGSSGNCSASTGFATSSGGYYAGSGGLNSAALLQLDSTSKGALIPRMTMSQFNAISSKPPGLIAMIVNPVDSNDILGLMFYTGSTTKYFQVI